jgi:hypothetical protein
VDLAGPYDLGAFARRDGETAAGEAAVGFNAGLAALRHRGFIAALNAGNRIVVQRIVPRPGRPSAS